MRKKMAIGFAALLTAGAVSGCEVNGLRSSASVGHQIIKAADRICADRGKTANIAWMEKRTDDVVVTCKDGTNHYYNG